MKCDLKTFKTYMGRNGEPFSFEKVNKNFIKSFSYKPPPSLSANSQ